MKLQLWRDRHCEAEIELNKPVEFGRQRVNEPNPFFVTDCGDHYRCVIAHHSENTVSRNQLRVEAKGMDLVVTNLNPTRGFELERRPELLPGESIRLELFTEFGFLDLRLKVQGDVSYQALPNQTLAPGKLTGLQDVLHTFRGQNVASLSDTKLSQAKLIDWLSTAMLVFQDAATSPRFLPRAADAVREIVKLSTAAVLLKEDGEWVNKAISVAEDTTEDWSPSSTILDLVEKEKRTFYNLCEQTSAAASLMGVKAIVASPHLSGENEVIGILYGDRRSQAGLQVEEIEAVLVEVLATGVAAGLARVHQEEKAIRAKADFERSFGKELTQHLEENPEMLAGRIEEITMMFCDVTGFSAVSEKLGPEKTMAWIGQVMGELHLCVTENQGVVIDYVGDELIAMWGAPVHQPDHAKLACATVHAIKDRLAAANEAKQFLTPANVRIGINTGPAHVGDTGTRYRLKYGAMGDTVNLASRLQGATKFFGCDTLISKATYLQLDGQLPCRRLGKVKVVNIRRPIELFELLPKKIDAKVSEEYERALQGMESGQLEFATGVIGKLAEDFPTDAPTQILKRRLSEITSERTSSADTINLVWELPTK